MNIHHARPREPRLIICQPHLNGRRSKLMEILFRQERKTRSVSPFVNAHGSRFARGNSAGVANGTFVISAKQSSGSAETRLCGYNEKS